MIAATFRRGLLAALGLLPCAAGCSKAPAPPIVRDVLFITMDTTRPDLIGAFGHPRPSTPSLDRIASAGAVFTRHYSTSSMTCPSHASMFTGLVPAEHGLVRNGRVLGAGLPTVAGELSLAGFQTAAVVGSKVLDRRFELDRGFDIYADQIAVGEGVRSTGAERPASEVVDVALEILATADRDRPLFLWVHVFDPHRPFVELEGRPRPGAIEHFMQRVEPSELYRLKRLATEFAQYEAEIHATDAELGRLLEAWDARAAAPDAPRPDAVVVTADHGEGMGEHGYARHMLYVYEEQIRVPLIVRARDAIEGGARSDAATSMLDLGRTLLGLAGAVDGSTGAGSFEGGRLPGEDLVPLLSDAAAPRTRVVAQRPLLGEHKLSMPAIAAALVMHPDRGRSRADQFALVADRGNVPLKYIWSSDTPPELYDLAADPTESDNLAARRTEMVAELQAELDAWRAGLREAPDSDELTDEDTLRMLEELGYR